MFQNPWEKKFHPMSLVQLLLRPSPWVVFCFHEVFATLAQKCPKTNGKTKKQKTKKQTNSFDPWRGSEEKLDR
jgi:hypothetical protein